MFAARISVILTLAAWTCSTQGADFSGQTVTIGHYFPAQNTVFDGTYQLTITSGSSPLQALSPFADKHPGYTVGFSDNTLNISFLDNVDFSSSPFHGLVVENLVCPDSASIQGTGPYSAFSYNGSTLALDWSGASVVQGVSYSVRFTPVPEPQSVVMFGFGFAILAFARGLFQESVRSRCPAVSSPRPGKPSGHPQS